MSNPIKNLGDYNTVREELKAVGGSLEALYKNVGDTAVAKATPKILAKGGAIGAVIILGALGTAYGGNKLYGFLKDRKSKIENEPALKKEFFKAIETESVKVDSEEAINCDTVNNEGVDTR